MSKTIDFNAYIVTKRKEKDDFWNGIGGAFKFKTDDGRDGIRVPSLNLVLLVPKEDDKNKASETQETDGGEA